MTTDHTPSNCQRGSSPSTPGQHGMDDWVRSIRTVNDSAAASHSREHDEYGTLPGRLVADSPADDIMTTPATP
jgi:hypothetical protein